MAAVIRIGASGFSYKEWLGHLYPPKLPGIKMLPYYAERLPTVEINYTFRAMPKSSMLEGWAQKTPLAFRFALKAPQRITHFARLRETKQSLDYFINTVRALGERLGPVLFQLPPDFGRDDQLITDFLAQIEGRVRAAFEFRNRSWFDDTVMDILRSAQAALCITESDRINSPVVKTADLVYMRLRKETYDEEGLAGWAQRIRSLARDSSDIYIFFKHEAAAPDLALRLAKLVGEV